ncbi:MAG: hypothetical protein IJJ26_13745, partial [Victivallales bacterium]|nr:hypothetical protein [Victivallales bacterium]
YQDGGFDLNKHLNANGMYRPMHIDEWGRCIPSPVMFPNGLKALAARCHANGVKFGVHMMRGLPSDAVRFNTPIKGTPYHARDIAMPEQDCSWCNYWTAVDIRKPGAQEYYDSEVEYLANELEVDFIKLDDVTEHPADVEAFARAIEKVERPILLSLSPGAEMYDSLFQRYVRYANMIRFTSDRWDKDEEIIPALERSYHLEKLAGPDCWMDIDMIPFGGLVQSISPSNPSPFVGCARQSKLTPSGKQALISLCAILCSPIIYGGDIPSTPQEDFDILLNPEVLACDRNGIPGRRIFYQKHTDIRKAPSRNHDGTGWLAIFNANNIPRHVFLNAKDLGFEQLPQLCDVWGGNRPVIPNPDGTVDFYLQKYGCAFLTYRQPQNPPQHAESVREHAFDILSERYAEQEPEAPMLADVTAAAEVLEGTDCQAPTEERFRALNVIKGAQDRVEPADYAAFCLAGLTLSQEQLASTYESFPALYWYDRAFAKVLAEVRETTVPAGETLLWHIYNMGYVVKTSTQCFALDLHHRRAEELIPYLDFLAITHNHGDHYTVRLAMAMNRAHKPVITNFFANDGYNVPFPENGYCKGPERSLRLGDITINTYEADHNVKLHAFVQPIEVKCGDSPDACVIFTAGDTCNAKQLHSRSQKIDFFLVHPYVGLKVDEAARLLQPRVTLISHLEEYHHPVGNARWTWRQGYDAARKIWETGHDAWVPVCGDKIPFHAANQK